MNTRLCGLCRHLDAREINSGVHYCWRFYVWRKADELVTDCAGAERSNGKAPPGQLVFEGERR